MTFDRTAISFFKSLKIKYYWNEDRGTITFPCFCCYKSIDMNVKDTRWECCHCEIDGTLADLIQISNRTDNIGYIETAKVYNPVKERRQINAAFSKLIRTNRGTKMGNELEKLYQKVNRLFEC